MALYRCGSSGGTMTQKLKETPSKSQVLKATVSAKFMLYEGYLYGNNVNPTQNTTPSEFYKFDRYISVIFENVVAGQTLLTFQSNSLPYNSSTNGQWAVYYN